MGLLRERRAQACRTAEVNRHRISAISQGSGLPQLGRRIPGILSGLHLCKSTFQRVISGDQVNATGYSIAQTFVQVLKQCGDDLTRENPA